MINIFKTMNKEQVILEFKKHLKEYIDLGSNIDEVGEENMEQQPGMDSPNMDMGGQEMGPDAGMQGQIGGDMQMGGEPQDPNMTNEPPSSPEGFNPQGIDQNTGIDGMGGQEPEQDPNIQQAEPVEDEEVIDVDDLTKAQEKTEDKIDSLSHKFSKLVDTIDSIEKKIGDMNSETTRYINSLKDEFEKRNPTPMQKMTMRTVKSTPYNMTTDEYMNNYAPDNYSAADDNNGEDDPQYKITKADIDNWTDYASMAREFEGKRSLHDILGY